MFAENPQPDGLTAEERISRLLFVINWRHERKSGLVVPAIFVRDTERFHCHSARASK